MNEQLSHADIAKRNIRGRFRRATGTAAGIMLAGFGMGATSAVIDNDAAGAALLVAGAVGAPVAISTENRRARKYAKGQVELCAQNYKTTNDGNYRHVITIDPVKQVLDEYKKYNAPWPEDPIGNELGPFMSINGALSGFVAAKLVEGSIEPSYERFAQVTTGMLAFLAVYGATQNGVMLHSAAGDFCQRIDNIASEGSGITIQ